MVDIIIIGIIAFSILVSLWRGFVSEALSLGGWIIAFLRNGVAAAILFIITLIVCGIISGLLQKMVDMTGVLSTTDRILGGAFGVLRGVLIVAALLFFADTFTSINQNELWTESKLIPHFDFIVKWFFEQLQANSSFLKTTN